MIANVRRRATSRGSSSAISRTAVMLRGVTAGSGFRVPGPGQFRTCETFRMTATARVPDPEPRSPPLRLRPPQKRPQLAHIPPLGGSELPCRDVVQLRFLAVAEGLADGGEVEVQRGRARGVAQRALP